MQAIIVTGGKQYVVNEGDTLFIEKLPVEAGDAVTFDQVLAIVDGENTKFGAPVVEGAKVEATVVKKMCIRDRPGTPRRARHRLLPPSTVFSVSSWYVPHSPACSASVSHFSSTSDVYKRQRVSARSFFGSA